MQTAKREDHGLTPVEFKVLILPEEVEETDPQLKRAKAAGLVLPETEKEREQMAQMFGRLIAIGGNAFTDWLGRRPQVGDRILFAKYAGSPVDGANGVKYRIASDKDIAAVVS